MADRIEPRPGPRTIEQRLEIFVNSLVARLEVYSMGCNDGAHTPCNVLEAVTQAVIAARQDADI